MNAATPIHLSDFNTPVEKLSLAILAAILAIPVLFILIFIFPITFILLPLTALVFLWFRPFRIHGIFILSSYAYLMIPNIFTGQNLDWFDKIISKVIGSAGFFLLQYIPSSTPDLPLIILFFWSLVLLPIVVLESFYWLVRSNHKFSAIILGIVLLLGSTYALQFGNKTIASFNAVRELKGTSLPVDELYESYGKPLYLEHDRGPVHLMPHWIYTNGSHVLSMTIDEHGIASIYENEYIFFD